ncbi:phosphonate ABC transporter, permease protein PhnE [Alkalicella caledoniensis]|uniref:Phosphonate ABC transporter, permease protein PhnE n=1 Tax=Alkalicella caledoniensis TaxID=2731377 RepID=A0A7G9W6U2_ALKCA|nr:phosphonate ABC transporter, permease protein PhnE [Alkalicella caledoniensis]QNO14404.1 phosphonate ABC transporter, permease protein PhnE [Alkalicella caledoniensis]
MNYYVVYMKKSKILKFLIVGIIILAIFLLSHGVQFNLFRVINGLPSMLDLLSRMSSPNWDYTVQVFDKLIETVEIAIVSTIMGLLLAIPFSLLSASNISPFKIMPYILNPLLSLMRTIPNLVWAALLVSIFSVGKLPGIIALLITAFLISTKLLKEQIEAISDNFLSSVVATGASSFQVLKYCVLPTIKTSAFSVFFAVFEINIRSATVLGLVGAGGIGQILWRDLNHLRYDNIATLILMLFLTIALIDMASIFFRKVWDEFYITVKDDRLYKLYQRVKPIFTSVFVGLLIFITMRNIDLNRVILGLGQSNQMILRMFNADFTYFSNMIVGIRESLFIALFATLVGGILAIPLSYLAAYGVSFSNVMAFIIKLIVNILRTFPPIIMAIIFFRGVGPGPLSGALALSIYTTGVLVKLYGEVLENTPKNIKLSLLSVGGGSFEIFQYGLFPHTFSAYVSLVLYRLESNIRTSTILGIIGAGGVGTMLTNNINWRNWERVGLLILGMAVMIIIVDGFSWFVRRKIIR